MQEFKCGQCRIALTILSAFFFPTGALAQSQLSGTVTDNSGAVVVGAVVALQNVSTGVVLRSKTNESGLYRFLSVQPGSYQLHCEAPGFKRFEHTGLEMETGASRLLDVKLDLGQVTETVSVTGAVALLDTESSTVGQFIDRGTVANMPLANRRVTSLVRLMGNISFAGTSQSDATPNFAMAGGRSGNQLWNLDGGVVQNMALGAPLITLNPPAESVQEFKMESSNYSAEFGRVGGGLINMTTRAGTNEFHGAAYEFLRNDKMDARSFFAQEKASFKYNIFGVSLGGPIRRDKTFFFFNFEGDRRSTGQTLFSIVPHPAERVGDFSQRRDLTVIDPVSRTPFPGNRIPSDRFDAIGAKLISFYPDPNIASDPTRAPVNNYLTNVSDTTKSEAYTGRFDHIFNDDNRVYVRFNYIQSDFDNGQRFPVAYADSRASTQFFNSTGIVGNWIRTIQPNLFNELRVNYTMRGNWTRADSAGSDPGLGIPGVDPDFFPVVSATGLTNLGLANWRNQTPILGWQFMDSLTWIKGKHEIKAGFEFRWAKNGEAQKATAGGTFAFNDRATANGPAALLLGWVNSGSALSYSGIDSRSDYYGAYIQDNWKVSQKLTLNLGLRWDMDTPRHVANNKQSGFDGSVLNPVSGTLGRVTFAGRDGYSEYAHQFDKNNISPRFGFAYRVNDRLVVRGGYGLSYNPAYAGAVPSVLVQGFATTTVIQSPDGGFTPPFLLAQGLPPIPEEALDAGWGTPAPGSAPFRSPDFIQQDLVNGYMQQWNLTIQRQIGQSMVVEAAYLSNIGRKLGANISANMIPLVNGRGPARQDQNLRPYPQFSDVLWRNRIWGDSNYQSLNLKFEKRYSKGLNLLSNFTWSKYLDNVPGSSELGGGPSPFQHVELHRLDWGLSGSDIPRRWVTSATYELPIGRGLRWDVRNPFLNALVGGWGLSLIVDLRDGSPWGASEQTDRSNTFSAGQRSNVLRDPNLPADRPRSEKVAQYFDTSAFAAPDVGTFGNAAKVLGHGPGFASIDTSLHKRWVIAEKVGLVFRGDVYNIANRPAFDNPNQRRGNANFGRIDSTLVGSERTVQLSLRLEF